MKNASTIKQLIEKLQELDQNLYVFMEGCDCYVPASTQLEIREDEDEGGCVLIRNLNNL